MPFYQGPENDTWKIMPSSSRPSSIIISFSKGRTLSSGMLNLPGACFTDDTILCTTAQSVHNQCITWQTVATASTPQWTRLLQSAVKIRARWLSKQACTNHMPQHHHKWKCGSWFDEIWLKHRWLEQWNALNKPPMVMWECRVRPACSKSPSPFLQPYGLSV